MSTSRNLKEAYDTQKEDFLRSLPNDAVLRELMVFNISLFSTQDTGVQTTEKIAILEQTISELKSEIDSLQEESSKQDNAFETSKQEYLTIVNRILQERK